MMKNGKKKVSGLNVGTILGAQRSNVYSDIYMYLKAMRNRMDIKKKFDSGLIIINPAVPFGKGTAGFTNRSDFFFTTFKVVRRAQNLKRISIKSQRPLEMSKFSDGYTYYTVLPLKGNTPYIGAVIIILYLNRV